MSRVGTGAGGAQVVARACTSQGRAAGAVRAAGVTAMITLAGSTPGRPLHHAHHDDDRPAVGDSIRIQSLQGVAEP